MKHFPVPTTGSSALQQAGVEQRDLAIGEVRLCEVSDLSVARLRLGDALAADEPLTRQLPVRTGQCTGSDPAFLCLGPAEWLVISSTATPPELVNALQKAAGERFAVAYDLTPGLVVLRLTGDGAPWLLSKISGLDFLGGASAGQHCARTRMADAAVTVYYHEPAKGEWAFDLFADRSLADYLWRLLRDCVPHANELSTTFGALR